MSNLAIEDFRLKLMDESKIEAMQSGMGPTLPFIELVLSELNDTKIISDPRTFYWAGKGASNSEILIYGYDLDEYDNSISIFTGIFDDTEEATTIGKTLIDTQAKKALRFVKESISPSKSFIDSLENESEDFRSIILEMMKSNLGISKFKIFFVTNGRMSDRLKKIPVSESIANIDVEIQIWDIMRLYSLLIESAKDYEDIEINLADFPETNGGLPFLEVPQAEENHFSCYLSVVPGVFLANIYKEYGSQLLEGNVRSFLSTKTSVNKKIQATINTEPAKFFVYNNGIAVTATKLEFADDKITKIQNMQIINGGQTTASLAYAQYRKSADISKISVQMKLTIVKETNPDDFSLIIQKISRSSNSQNKVTDADFFANHEFHINMEKIALGTQAPPKKGVTYGTYWFYERAKGQYNQKKLFLTKNEANKFETQYPKKQLISKTDFSKYHNTWKGMPQIVSKGALTNFNIFAKEIELAWESESKKASYNEYYFKKIIGIAILFKKLENEIKPNLLSWYKGSYRANMITYSLAIFFKLIDDKYPEYSFDFERLWIRQEASTELTTLLLKIAQLVYFSITSEKREVENVTQWCKRDRCWQVIQEQLSHFPLPQEAVKPYLEKKDVLKSKESAAKHDQKVDNEIDMLKLVASPDKIFKWPQLQIYVNSHMKELTPSPNELKALEGVKRMCAGKSSNQTNYQCKLALGLWKKAVDNGWKS